MPLLLLGQERNEIVQLRRGQLLAEVLWHDALREARDNIGVRVDDRLLRVRRERAAVGLLGICRKLVEVGSDRRLRAGRREGVTRHAALSSEERLALRRI